MVNLRTLAYRITPIRIRRFSDWIAMNGKWSEVAQIASPHSVAMFRFYGSGS